MSHDARTTPKQTASIEGSSKSTNTQSISYNQSDIDEEEALGIYSDDDESAGDLSDDEPPITEQDLSGRPQSQFKLRVTSAISQTPRTGRDNSEPYLDISLTNHIDHIAAGAEHGAHYNALTEESYDQLGELDINSESSVSHRLQQTENKHQNDVSKHQNSSISKDTKVK